MIAKIQSKHSILTQSIRLLNAVLDDRSLPINNSGTRKKPLTLAHLRSRYCGLLGSYKSRIKKDAKLNICADCGMRPHDAKHFFIFPAHQTTMTLFSYVIVLVSSKYFHHGPSFCIIISYFILVCVKIKEVNHPTKPMTVLSITSQ